MADPFAAANAVLFRSPRSAAATFTPAGEQPLPEIRVIRTRGTAEIEHGRGQILDDTNVVQIQRRDVVQPMRGDHLAIGDEHFIIQEGARLDAAGLNWTCMLEPA